MEADAKVHEIVWTQSTKTGKQHRWKVIVPTRDGKTLARNLDTHVQKELYSVEWRRNPADLI